MVLQERNAEIIFDSLVERLLHGAFFIHFLLNYCTPFGEITAIFFVNRMCLVIKIKK